MSLRFQRNIPGTQRIRRPQGHSAAGRITSIKNSNDTIGNETNDLPACVAVPQPTAPPQYEQMCVRSYIIATYC